MEKSVEQTNIPRFSIIIPVYNAERYLEECLNSIKNQTTGDYEVIIIDDGSTDESRRIAENFATMDDRFIVYSYVNGGISEARNRGLAQAEGKYILFMDADDTINPELLEKLTDFTERDIDIVRFGAIVEGDKERKNPYRFNETYTNEVLSGAQAIKRWAMSKQRYATVWLYCVKKEIYDRIRFVKMQPYEDVATMPQVIGSADTVAMLDYIGYNYIQRENSITNTNGHEKRMKNVKGFILAYDIVNEAMRELYLKYPDEPDFEEIFVEDFYMRLEDKFRTESDFMCIVDLARELASRHKRFNIDHNKKKYYTDSDFRGTKAITNIRRNFEQEARRVLKRGGLTVDRIGNYGFEIKGVKKEIGIFRMERRNAKEELEMQFLFFSNNDFEMAQAQPDMGEVVDKYLLSYTNLFLAQVQNGTYIGEVVMDEDGQYQIRFDEDMTIFATKFNEFPNLIQPEDGEINL